jgi:flagellum-specific peptidoglycan hydrolase FlgJ
VTVSTGGVITGFNFVPGAAATMTSPTSVPVNLLALEQAAQPGAHGNVAIAGDSTARATGNAQLRSAIVNVAGYYLQLAKTRTPAQMEALIWDNTSSNGVDHGDTCAAFASLTLELAAQTVGLQSWATGGSTYPWPLPDWADVRVQTNPASPAITSLVADAQAHGRWHPVGDGYQPQPGDWTVFNGHVEVVTKYAGGVLDTIGADSLPNLTVNAHSWDAPAEQGVVGFVDNGNLQPTAGAVGAAAPAGGPEASPAPAVKQPTQAAKPPTAAAEPSGSAPAKARQAASAKPGTSSAATADGAAVPGVLATGDLLGGAAAGGASSQPASASPGGDSAASIPGLPAAVQGTGAAAIPGATASLGDSGSGSGAKPAKSAKSAQSGPAAPSPAAPSDGAGTSSGTSSGTKPKAASPAPSAPAKPTVTPTAKPSAKSPASSGRQYSTPGTTRQQSFISLVAPGAMAAQQRYGVPAAVTIAQAIEESAWGQSGLAAQYHNLFGIKGSGPAGSVSLPTSEYENGQWVTIDAQFRVYHNDAESIADHAELLATSGYYTRAMADRNVPDAFANDLTGVYATDPDYGANLIALMKLYNLYQYDSAPTAAASAPATHASTPAAPASTPAPAPSASPSPSPSGTPSATTPASPSTTPSASRAPTATGGTAGGTTGSPSASPSAAPSGASSGSGPASAPTAPAQPAATPTVSPSSGTWHASVPGVPAPALAPTASSTPSSSGAGTAQTSAAASAPIPGLVAPAPLAPAGPRANPAPSANPVPSANATATTDAVTTAYITHVSTRPAPSGRTARRPAPYAAQLPNAVSTALFAQAKAPLARGEHLYRDVAACTGSSWKLLAAVDWMQCKADPRYSPVQGEKLGARNADGTTYTTKSAALTQCACDLVELSAAVYGIDLTARRPLSVRELAAAFAAFRWGAILRRQGVSPMEFPYAVAGLTAQHQKMHWPAVDAPDAPDRPGARFREPFGAVPVVLSLGYPATV